MIGARRARHAAHLARGAVQAADLKVSADRKKCCVITFFIVVVLVAAAAGVLIWLLNKKPGDDKHP